MYVCVCVCVCVSSHTHIPSSALSASTVEYTDCISAERQDLLLPTSDLIITLNTYV